MGGWEVLVIPIIGVAVWIIATLVRGAEEAKKAGGPAQRKPENVTDLDRFVREAQRRREAAERGDNQRTRRTPPREEEIPLALPVDEVLAAQFVSGAPVMRSVEAPPLPSMPADTSPGSLAPRPDSAVLVGLGELLRSRDGLRKAMILQQIFGPPASRRRARTPHGSR